MRAPAASGFTLIELLIGIAVLGLVMMIGLPSLTVWLQNTQIRNSTESIQAGLQLARAEALKRNAAVRFQLVTALNSACVLSTSGRSWVVSLADPTGKCEVAESETVDPFIIQKADNSQSAPNSTVTATGGSSVTFNGLGRVTGGGFTRIDVANSTGACQTAAGPMRCLALQINTGGQLRMCDPAVGTAADPRFCTP